MITRRSLILMLGAALSPRAAFAQAKQTPILIGWLNSDSRDLSGQNLAAFKEGLAALGWKERVQYVMEERWAEGRRERLQPFADELAAKKPAIIVAALSVAVPAAAKAAPTTPIVIVTGAVPEGSVLIKSLARPGGWVTGVTTVTANTAEKHLELLINAAPKLKRIGILADPTSEVGASAMNAVRRSTAQYAVEARLVEVTRPEDMEAALSRVARQGVQGLIVTGGPVLRSERTRIVKFALAQRWPLVGGQGGWAEAGALLSYSADVLANYRRAAYYVDRIAKGAKPGDLPIEQPTKFDLVVNLKTAKALGLTMPQSILLQADKVIE